MARNDLDVASLIRKARGAAGWSQRVLGEAAGIPQSHVAKIESGVDVRASTLRRVLSALGYEMVLRRSVRSMFLAPPPGGKVAAARDFGVDLKQLLASFSASPAKRFEKAVRGANNLARLMR